MLLPETKEREYRFKLALRIGLPIFALVFALISSTLITTYESLQASFYFTSILLLAFSIYFILFLIYRGFDIKITDDISKAFTREYLYYYLNKEIKKHEEYSLMLISIDNLNDINTRYGLKNGDKVLYETVNYIGKYLENQKIVTFPVGHIKGGDFVIGLDGKKDDFNTILELFCLKSSEFKVNEIEVNISGAITDTSFSNTLEYLIENLFELQNENRNKKISKNKDTIKPNDLESYVIDAIENQSVEIMTQDVFQNNKVVMRECFIKLRSSNNEILHPKSYIKVVNRLGLRAEYDFLILENTIRNCIENYNKMFSIVIDPTSLRNHSFLNKTKELLRDNAHIKNRVVFMISENEYYSHTNKFNSILQSLRKEGVKICIDRLGSLHSSFLYLRELDIDMVRFDGSYTKDISTQATQSILQGFNLMAHEKGIATWLKMIENEKTKEFIQEIGIDYIQGKVLSELKTMEKL